MATPPPAEQAKRYVDCLGGADSAVAKAREYLSDGDDRFAAELLNHVVFAEPDHAEAKDLLAHAYDQLGFAAENGTWRNFYLTGAQERRHGIQPVPTNISGGLAAALTVEQVFDSLAIRVNGPRADGHGLRIDWHVTDVDQHVRTALSNGALSQEPVRAGTADLDITLTKPQLLALVGGSQPDGATFRGDRAVLGRLLELLDQPDPNFPIVTP